MKKVTLLFTLLFFSVGYSQLALEGFENTSGPTALPNWTLGTGNWSVFDNGVGTGNSWDINSGVAIPPLVYAGINAAYMNREFTGPGLTAEDYLATPLVTIPANGQLRFWTRSFTTGNQGTLYDIRVAPATATVTNPAAYTSILTTPYTEDTLSAVFNIYEEKVIDFPVSYIGQQVYVAFVMKFTQIGTLIEGDRWLVDNVRIVSKCLNPSALTATPATTTASLSWANPSGATSWEIEVLPAATAPTGTGVIYNGTLPYVASGLTANTPYKFYVRALCSATLSSNWVGPFNFSTLVAPPACGGNFVDNGGPTGNYLNNSDVTTTICPVTAGDKVTVTFTSFNTEANWDGLYVFNGNSITSPQIASANPAANVPGGLAGSYWGTTIPGPFTSTATNGCLTFRFRSDSSFNFPGWISNITCAPPPTCQKPNLLVSSAISTTSFTLGWTSNSIATTWQILTLPCGSPLPTASTTGFITSTTNPFTVNTGLSPDTCYSVYVRGVCSPTDLSAWSDPLTVTTSQIPPVCGGTFSDLGGSSSNYPNNADSTTTICPTVAGQVVTVIFSTFNTQANNDGLYVYNGNSIASPQITSANPSGNVPGGVPGSFWGTTVPGPFTSSSTDGCLTFRFISDSTTNASGWTSNVTCTTPVACANPFSLSASAVTISSASISWTNPTSATTFNILALPCGSPPPTATSTGFIVATSNPFTLTGLLSATCYDVYVRNVCSTTSSSVWSPIATTFTTLIAPPVCGGNYVDNGGISGNYLDSSDDTTTICPTIPGQLVTVTFTSFSTEATWDGLYVFDGNSITSPQITSTNPAGNVPGGLAGSYWGTTIPGPFTSSNLTNGCLTFRFRSDVSFNYPGWVANVTCAPPPTCPKPTTLTATSLTQTSASLGWTSNSSATQWQILVLPLGSPVPTATTTGFISAPTNPFLVVGLSPGTQYTYYVRGICSPTDSSLWSSGLNFSTLISNDTCANAIFAPVNTTSTCDQVVSGSIFGATASIPAISLTTPCIGNPDDDVWFKFIASNTYHNVSLSNVIGSTTNLNFAVYSGSCTSLVQIACSAAFNLTGGVNGLTVGQTYYVRIYSNGSLAETTSFNLCISTPSTCATASTACSTTTYSNTTGITSLGTIGCLFSTPNPSYFTIQVLTSGSINYLLTQSTPGSPTPNLDVDYVAWGPFTNPTAGCTAITGGAPPLTGLTTGCSFSAAATENFNIANAVAGEFYIILITNFSNQNGVVNLTQTNLGLPGASSTLCCSDAEFKYTPSSFCKTSGATNPISIITPGSVAGVFTSSSPNLVFANTTTGEINLSASLAGYYLITNTVAATGTCSVKTYSYTVTITDGANPATAISYPATSYCTNITALQTPTIVGSTGGFFSVAPLGLTIDSITGIINPNTSTPGNYTVNYSVSTGGGCLTLVKTALITINAVTTPVTGFSYTSPICKNAINPSPISATGFVFGGVYSSTPGLIINSGTGVIDLALSNAGTYTVTYSLAANPSACLASGSSTTTITINPLVIPVTSFSYVSPVCAYNTNPTPIPATGFTTGGIYSSTAGLSINSTTGVINLATTLPGNYTVNYSTLADITLCKPSSTSTANIIISSDVIPIITGTCAGSQYVLTASPLNSSYTDAGSTFLWSTGSGSPLGSAATQAVGSLGTYSVKVTNSSGCFGIANITVDAITCIIPKGISADGDGINDVWDLSNFKVKQLSIFNRYGIKVYSKTDYIKEWGGQQDNGAELPDGTYYYIIERNGLDASTGWVYLNRQNK